MKLLTSGKKFKLFNVSLLIIFTFNIQAYFNNNNFTNLLPYSMKNLSSLETIYLNDNNFNGSLNIIKNLSNLIEVYAMNNNFNEYLDKDFGINLIKLITFNISNNNITGSFPTGIFFNINQLTFFIYQ